MEEYTVSRLSRLIKSSVEQNFSKIHLKAEVSALKVHSSGHIYFTLKDSDAVIDAICWKGVALKHKLALEDGMEIKCIGQVTTYPMRSKYQFVVEQFELAGIGELLKILSERKRKLTEEGLFDAAKKKSLPKLPKLIGIITSPTGAVIKDILHRIRERFPRNILLWPVLVQGADASRQITEAIQGMNGLPPDKIPDVLIVARGGGNFEDLMPFNEENVVRAVADSNIPIVSAIGHETDFTLIDFAADMRAPTPTAAAEFIVPERIKLLSDVSNAYARLNLVIANSLENKRLFLRSNKMLDATSLISTKNQQVDFAFDKLISTMFNMISNKKILLARMVINKPIIKENSNDLYQKISFLVSSKLKSSFNCFALAANAIESNSYMNILKKGFAFAESVNGKHISSAKDAKTSHEFSLYFHDGKVRVTTH